MVPKIKPRVAVKPKRPAGGRPRADRQTAAIPPATAPVTLKRVSKGKRPQFHDHEAVDQLFAIVTALACELSVALDRIDTLERVLVTKGSLEPDSVEAYQPDAAAAALRNGRREGLIQRVFSVFEAHESAGRG